MHLGAKISTIVILAVLGTPAIATAQEADPPIEAPPAEESVPDQASSATGSDSSDGARRRRLTAAMGGLESVSDDYGNKLSAPMGGLDVAFGTQINDIIGIYVPLHLSFGVFQGVGTAAGLPLGATGTLAATVVVDATLIDRVFIGGGAGVGILNNPTGPCVHLRAGGYPLVSRVEGTNRRKGLAVSADLRLIYTKYYKGTFPGVSIGYASF